MPPTMAAVQMTMPSISPEGPRRADVVLLFDASPASLVAVAAAQARARSRAGLRALYIEEHDWLCSAAYPFAAEVGAGSGALLRYDAAALERRLQRRRAHVRKRLRMAAGDTALVFDVLRGRSIEQVMAVLAPDDVLVIGRVGYTSAIGRAIGSLALSLARRVRGEVMLTALREASRSDPIVVLLDAPEATARLLAAAAERARERQAPLRIQLLPKGADEKLLTAWLASSELAISVQRLPARGQAWSQGDPLVSALAGSGAELLLSRRGTLLQSASAAALLARFPGTVSVLP